MPPAPKRGADPNRPPDGVSSRGDGWNEVRRTRRALGVSGRRGLFNHGRGKLPRRPSDSSKVRLCLGSSPATSKWVPYGVSLNFCFASQKSGSQGPPGLHIRCQGRADHRVPLHPGAGKLRNPKNIPPSNSSKTRHCDFHVSLYGCISQLTCTLQDDCFYEGFVEGSPGSIVALSTCYGIR